MYFNQNVTITRLLKRTNLCRIRRIYQQCLKTHLTNKKSTRLKYNKDTYSIKIVVIFTRYLTHFLSGKNNFFNGFTYFHNYPNYNTTSNVPRNIFNDAKVKKWLYVKDVLRLLRCSVELTMKSKTVRPRCRAHFHILVFRKTNKQTGFC